jgi:2-methylcitrate dehydratase
MEGPKDVFDGEKGWKHIVAGDFEAELDPACEAVHTVMTKKYVAETYSQSAVEGLLELVREHNIDPEEMESIHLDTFQGAYQIIGGGAGGDRYEVEDKEQADHSLPYMLAVAVLDGQILNKQYAKERIQQDDVQTLLRKVTVAEDDELTERFNEGEMPARLEVETTDGETYGKEKTDFDGHPNNSASWEMIENKFHTMTEGFYEEKHRRKIIEAVRNLEEYSVQEIVTLLD